MPESCPICEKPLYSIITRRVGDVAVCLECGDMLNPLVVSIAKGIVARAQAYVAEGLSTVVTATQLRTFVLNEIDENFAPLISDAADLRTITNAR